MQRGRDRANRGWRVHAEADAEQRAGDPESDGPLPEPQCARRSNLGDARLCLNPPISKWIWKTSTRTRLADAFRCERTVKSSKPIRPFAAGPAARRTN